MQSFALRIDRADVSFITEKAADGSSMHTMSIGGRVGFLGSFLILMDVEDFVGSRKMTNIVP